uniref:Uncharacterized protein n=1 Tax=Arundo donax TaxID=35708 RepID=A0A0A9DK32_ARUDO
MPLSRPSPSRMNTTAHWFSCIELNPFYFQNTQKLCVSFSLRINRSIELNFMRINSTRRGK